MNSSYITSAQKAEQLPDLGACPEIAFVGRSNCGKSTLLNALLGRTGLARTSNTPGRTQMVNFFALDQGEKRLIFADLPGYGYAATSKATKKLWEGLVESYLERTQIREVLMLLDSRRVTALPDEDLLLLDHIIRREPAVVVTVVLTKTDKLNQSEMSKARAAVDKILGDEDRVRVIAVSSLKKTGIDLLRREILRHMP